MRKITIAAISLMFMSCSQEETTSLVENEGREEAVRYTVSWSSNGVNPSARFKNHTVNEDGVYVIVEGGLKNECVVEFKRGDFVEFSVNSGGAYSDTYCRLKIEQDKKVVYEIEGNAGVGYYGLLVK